MKKQIGVIEEVYDDLKKFRNEKGLTSFSNAIRTLLNAESNFVSREDFDDLKKKVTKLEEMLNE